jgi:hypothetical protein
MVIFNHNKIDVWKRSKKYFNENDVNNNLKILSSYFVSKQLKKEDYCFKVVNNSSVKIIDNDEV